MARPKDGFEARLPGIKTTVLDLILQGVRRSAVLRYLTGEVAIGEDRPVARPDRALVGSRAAAARAGVVSTLLVAAVIVCPVATASAANPVPFLTTTGACGSPAFQTAPASSDHPHALVRLSGPSSPGTLRLPGTYQTLDEGWQFGGGDTVWAIYPNGQRGGGEPGGLGADERGRGEVECTSGTYTVDFIDAPVAPTTFEGASTWPCSGNYLVAQQGCSNIAVVIPAAGDYVADIGVSQGALSVRFPNRWDQARTFASRGEFDLGSLGRGLLRLEMTPRDGPQARWQITIRALPVQLADVAFKPTLIQPGQETTLAYTINADAAVTADLLDRNSDTVRQLAGALPVPAGDHSLTWDGLDRTGRPVADGLYRASLRARDTFGNETGSEAALTVDGTPPKIRPITRSKLSRRKGLVVSVSDRVSGVASATLSVDGTLVRRIAGAGRLIYRPPRGWTRGRRYTYRVTASDHAGNARKLTRRFRAR